MTTRTMQINLVYDVTRHDYIMHIDPSVINEFMDLVRVGANVANDADRGPYEIEFLLRQETVKWVPVKYATNPLPEES